MKIHYPYILLAILGVSISAISQAQTDDHDIVFTIPEIALVDIEPNNSPLILSFDLPTEAGAPITTSGNAINNSKWLNYSSSLSPNAATRNVLVHISGGTLPNGINLTLQANPNSGIGQGLLGSPAGLINLNSTPQILISGIGGAYTGDGVSNGHQLIYSLLFAEYGGLDFNASTTIEVIYTITD